MSKSKKKIKAAKVDAWFVYILRCSDGSLYTGVATDVKRRSKQHNAGTASRYTRSRLPVRVNYQEPLASRSLALKREWAVKAMTRLEKESLIRRASQSSRRQEPK
ncbi:MAG: GIY-YIG nuclease family protein [Planctomycetes bacterium]|nr:GIY-YIG nuclease family protein [Planctomycetota bacterium]MBI3835507.1 GIY-YIG nuclease family protein [Planctomycetota bacterium]